MEAGPVRGGGVAQLLLLCGGSVSSASFIVDAALFFLFSLLPMIAAVYLTRSPRPTYQVDIVPELAPCYESEDESMGRRNKIVGDLHLQRNKRGTPLYSKEDIREQYCITRQQLDVLERARGSGLFGCLSNYHESSCHSRNSLLSVCVRRKVPSDENLVELCRRPAASYAPLPRWPRYAAPPPSVAELCGHYDSDYELECSYFRRARHARPADPKRYTWMSEDEESTRLERPRPILDEIYLDQYGGGRRIPSRYHHHHHHHPHYMSYSSEYLACPAHPDLPPPPPPPPIPPSVNLPPTLHDQAAPPPRTKHVSFARSHTLTSFDDAIQSPPTKPPVIARSQERLIDGKKFTGGSDQTTGTGSASESSKVVIMEKLKRTPMKTQATQTEVCLGRKPLAPNYLSLSPRTVHRVRMVSQGAQTNGGGIAARRLMKSYSEAGGASLGVVEDENSRRGSEHEPLHRTQSEEPPRSPFLMTTPPESVTSLAQEPRPTSYQQKMHSVQREQQEQEVVEEQEQQQQQQQQLQTRDSTAKKKKTYKEIFIDFEPQEVERRAKKRMLQKTLSEGEILMNRDEQQTDMYNSYTETDGSHGEDEEESSKDHKLTEDLDYPYYTDECQNGYLETYMRGHVSTRSAGQTSDGENGSPQFIEEIQEDEFHENLIYHGLFRKRSISLEDTASDPDVAAFQRVNNGEDEISEAKSAPPFVQGTHYKEGDLDDSEEDQTQVEDSKKEGEECSPRVDRDVEALPLTQRSSPFASSDSLANDMKDHSDGIWNESQATVLQVADGDINGVSGNLLALTPSSRRKQLLLLQHQQRSSMDTEALDEEDAQVPQAPSSPRIRIETPSSLKSNSSAVSTSSQEVPQLKELSLQPRGQSSSDRLNRSAAPVSIEEKAIPSSSQQELQQKKSPSATAHTPEIGPDATHQILPALDSADGSVRSVGGITVPDLLMLARTDSGGKTGTDISETSTCTTEDYVTANDTNNSGTDTSSRRSLAHNAMIEHPEGYPSSKGGSIGGAGDGSSFESASSIYSLAREINSEDIIQVSYSPPPIQEESDLPTTPQVESEDNQTSTTPRVSIDMTASQQQPSIPAPEHGATSPSGESSSSGSYSVDGSEDEAEAKEAAAQLLEKPLSGSDEEERSAHYSSYYESPPDEDGDGLQDRREWTEEEKCRRKKGFKLDFSPLMDQEELEAPSSPTGRNQVKEAESWSRRSSKSEHSLKEEAWKQKKMATPPSGEVTMEKTYSLSRKTKSHTRSPVQHHRRTPSSVTAALPGGPVQSSTKKTYREKAADKEVITPGMVRSPAMHEGFRAEDWGALQRTSTPAHTPEEGTLLGNNMNNTQAIGDGADGTSDDSSCGTAGISARRISETGNNSGGGGHITPTQTQQLSPRRHRRVRESPRRKAAPGGGRSPTTSQQRLRRRSGSTEEKGLNVTAAMARRRSSIPAKPTLQQVHIGGNGISATIDSTEEAPSSAPATIPRGSRLSPHRYSRSPGGSPSRSKHRSRGSPKLPAIDVSSNKAQGAMSPESSRLKALSAESLRSVSPGSDSVFYSEGADHSSNTTTLCHHCGREVDKNATLSGLDDTEPSGGGEVTEPEPPDIVQPPAGFADSPEGPRTKPAGGGGRLYKKLEKRFRSEERSGHGERRHHSRYRCDGARAKSEERGREDRVKLRPLARSTDASMEVLRAANSSPNVMIRDSSLPNLSGEAGSTDEEEDVGVYADSYKSSTWIYIGDSEEVHVWQKPESKLEEKEDKGVEGDKEESSSTRRGSGESTASERDFRRKYQAITHRMVHRKSSVEMYKRLASKSFECDKTVVVRRESGEFGFRIHGSRPVVVSAIEPDTPAETSGLEVGDIVISINGVNVLDASHSEVVKIAHAGSDTLELEVARTCNVLTPVVREPGAGTPLYSGYLWKLGGVSNGAKWVQRYFCLKRDNCLYYYKNETESQPLGALMLMDYNVSRTPDSGHLYSFQLEKSGCAGLHLAADDEESEMRWLAVISHSIERNAQVDEWLDISNRNLRLAASAVQQPDCFGYLMKLSHKWKAWKRRYCVLKDACLYFYKDGSSDAAIGMACLHGYRVQNSTVGGKRFAFEILPPEPCQKYFYFHTDSEMDKKRWLAALEYSIDRWIKVG